MTQSAFIQENILLETADERMADLLNAHFATMGPLLASEIDIDGDALRFLDRVNITLALLEI